MVKGKLSTRSVGWLYFFIHFSCEVACFYFLFSRLNDNPLWWILAMLFDALAFLPQTIFGVLQDKFAALPFGIIGAILIFIALIVPFDIISLIVIGLGNALLHIDGAEHTLHGSKGKITPNAVFVGGGSFGVITGQLLGALKIKYLFFIPVGLILISIALAFIIYKSHDLKSDDGWTGRSLEITSNINQTLFILLIAFAVAVRSYIAYALPIEWKKTTFQAILLFSFMGIGKMLGGVFADGIGYKKTTIISLLVALPFLLFGNSIMTLSLIGVMLFSMTMPITVGILIIKLPDNLGLAFGITTVGLFLGIVPALIFTLPSLLSHQIVVLVLSVVALVSILVCLRKEKKNVK